MKEKIEKFISKYDEIILVIISFIIYGYTLYVNLIIGDELWNFNNVYKMYNGYKIYVDANVITTPLFHIIGLGLFKILGANFFIFRIYNILMWTFLTLGIYKIYKALNISKIYSILFTEIIFGILMLAAQGMANYNTLAMIFVIYGILVILKKDKYSKEKYILYESILIILIFLSKQNIGIYYIIGYIIYAILKKEKKETLEIFGIVGIGLLIFIFILYLTKTLNGFINYAFMSIGQFGRKNYAVGDELLILVGINSINIIILFLENYNNKINKEDKVENKKLLDKLNIIAIFAFLMNLFAYPIFNMSHIFYSLILQVILLCGIIYKKNYYKIKNNMKINCIIKDIIIILIVTIIYISVIYEISTLKYYKKKNIPYSDAFFGAIIEDNQLAKIKKVDEFILNSKKRVIILSTDAALYNIPIKYSNGYFDLLNYGNTGKETEEDVINRIKNSTNIIYVLSKDNKASWQEMEQMKDYVRRNLKKIGEIEDLEIYEK